jgi:pimeloyl-ACP methyl ester carboxylesterase
VGETIQIKSKPMKQHKTILGNGMEIAYLERPGQASPVVLLHGITEGALTYEPLFDQIAPAAQVFALDFRGHGESAKPDAVYDTEAYADDVRCFISEVVGGPVLLVGHSLGGVVAMQVALTAPDLVTQLMLEDPPVFFVNKLNDTYRALFEGVVVMSQTLQDGSMSRDQWFEVMANDPDPYSGKPGIETMGAQRINLLLDSISRMKPKAMQDALAGSLEWDGDAVLAGIGCPFSVLVGDEALGAVVSTAEADRIEHNHALSRIVRVADVGHMIHDEKPEVWLQTLNGLINKAN